MKFKDFPYVHPEEEKLLAFLEENRRQLQEAENYAEFKKAFDELDEAYRHFHTMEIICSIRHTVDTRDAFYTEEDDYFDQIEPVLGNEMNETYKVVFASPFLEDLKKDVPETWFTTISNSMKTIKPEIIPDLQAENKAASDYQKLFASAQIEFDGKMHTMATLSEPMNSKDRSVRERAHKAYWQWMADHEEEFGEIYDRLVKIRTNIARKLGYENYIPLAYLRMNRMDYDQNDVEQYRKNVLEDVVPVATMLYQEQAKRIGSDTEGLAAWDEKCEFLSGNPVPKHSKDEMVQAALEMYQELDPKTGEFFQFMVDYDLMDLEAKPGKAAGGYCTMIPDYNAPFIFSNFNHTQHDVEVLTHEAGHAFQAYSSQDIRPSRSIWPTMESAEIDSMSMEFFTWPWMHKFFEEDTDKFYYIHLGDAVKFLPYGVTVDHFQHEVYAHPEWTPQQRMDCWRKLEKMYSPHKDYTGIDFLERGGWWMKQLHIFLNPFYYIDYTLAQVCALQFWKRAQENDPQAFEDYKAICATGGKLPFKKIVEKANLKVPFEKGCLKETMEAVKDWYADKDVSGY